MITNEARTLLLNIAGSNARASDYPGEEFVESNFSPVNLTPPLAGARNLLFGRNPDRAMRNYRLRQYMGMLHGSRLEPYVLDLDSRITYFPIRDEELFKPANFGPIVTKIGATTAELYPQGGTPPVDVEIGLRSWIITVLNATDVQITQTEGGSTDVIESYVITGGVSNVISIPGVELGFFFQAGIGNKWQLDFQTRPSISLSEILRCFDLGLSRDMRRALFGPAEPYLSFTNLFFTRKELVLRLGAAVLALAYRTRDLR